MCASGARSPLAPTEPWDGTTGVTPASKSRSSPRSTGGETPLCPRASVLARRAIARRTSPSGNGGPTPAAWARRRFNWSASRRSRGMATPWNFPNPVETP